MVHGLPPSTPRTPGGSRSSNTSPAGSPSCPALTDGGIGRRVSSLPASGTSRIPYVISSANRAEAKWPRRASTARSAATHDSPGKAAAR
ncbi:hypothetical protein [Nonomuraea rubra]|uniref:hypothetical protein n=1 Tax=Nonomuraea rubra TaxID=46180 RepID=UPI0031ED5EE8